MRRKRRERTHSVRATVRIGELMKTGSYCIWMSTRAERRSGRSSSGGGRCFGRVAGESVGSGSGGHASPNTWISLPTADQRRRAVLSFWAGRSRSSYSCS
jgi:hypothetical protein